VKEQSERMELIVKFKSDAAVPNTAAHRAIHACAAGLGIALQPMHPHTDDPELSSYYLAQVPDPTAISHIAEELLRCEGVEGAYQKAGGQLP